MSVEETTNVPAAGEEETAYTPAPQATRPSAHATDEATYEQASYAPPAAETWAEEPLEELPPRPRRRLLGKGGSPSFLALLGVLLIACGFIGGVLVEKGQTSSTAGSGASSLASRFAALRSAGASTTGTGSSAGKTAGGGFAGAFGGLGGAASATVGEVSFVGGSTLYVTNSEGTTVKVATSPASSITKTVKADVHGIHPGETVVVRGAKGSDGVVSAESISVGGAAGGGIASLFGGGGAGRGSSATGGSSRTGGAGPSLFGE
jgi:hypothetical protein